jgi:hypothetical protein
MRVPVHCSCDSFDGLRGGEASAPQHDVDHVGGVIDNKAWLE